MTRFFIGLVLVSFLVACGSSPTPQIQKQDPPLPQQPPLERIMGVYTGDFSMEEPYTEITPPIVTTGDLLITLKEDGSFAGTVTRKAINEFGFGWVNIDPEEGTIAGKIIEISEFGTNGTLELEVVFPTSGTFAGENDWTNNGNYFVSSFYEQNIDDSYFTKFEIRAVNESLFAE